MSALENLGIDIYSLLVYTVNFGIIFSVVYYFLNKPIINILEKRSNTIKNNLEEAEKLKDQLVRQQKEMENEREKMRSQMSEEIRKLNIELDRKRSEAESEIEKTRIRMMTEIKEISRNQKRTIQEEIKSELIGMVKKMVIYISSEKIPESYIEESIEEAWSKFKNQNYDH